LLANNSYTAPMGILNRLFGGRSGVEPRGMTDDEAVKIINAYGKAMMDKKSQFGELSDLPYPKTLIKEAIVHGIRVGDNPRFREQLKAAYIALSDWQAGFGSRPGAGELTAEELRDPAKAMARITAMADDFAKVPEEVAAEAALLQAELKALGV
jgi:hypothetical protein